MRARLFQNRLDLVCGTNIFFRFVRNRLAFECIKEPHARILLPQSHLLELGLREHSLFLFKRGTFCKV